MYTYYFRLLPVPFPYPVPLPNDSLSLIKKGIIFYLMLFLLFSTASLSCSLSSVLLIFFPLKKLACQDIQDIVEKVRTWIICLISFPGILLD